MPTDSQRAALAEPPEEVLDFPFQPEDVTPEWLTSVLQAERDIKGDSVVTEVTFDSLSEGVGMMGTVSRLHLGYSTVGAGPASLILKSASTSSTNREVAAQFHLYEREVNFFKTMSRELEPTVPHSYFAECAADSVDYAILMQDFFGYTTGDQVKGAEIAEARLAVEALAKFHAHYWEEADAASLSWVPSTNSTLVRDSMISASKSGWDTMVDLFAADLPQQLVESRDLYLASLPALYEEMSHPPQTLAHTDYRADNLLFGVRPDQQPIVILDWSAVAKSKGVQDLAYFLTQNLSDECGKRYEEELQSLYYRTLVEAGVPTYSKEQFAEDYDVAVLFNFVYAVVIASALDISNTRATAFVGKLAGRSARCIIAKNLLDRLPGLAGH